MIFDHRTYTIQPGKTNEYVKIFEEFAYPVAMKHRSEEHTSELQSHS